MVNTDFLTAFGGGSDYASNGSGSRKAAGGVKTANDKSDRATSEQVLDPRTRIILFKLLNRNFIKEINGCISTGKEANVYHATTETTEHYAIKVYKTSILVFKDRDRYVTGEFRFRAGYSRHNPRKMVKVWAEKEMRNLKRLHTAGIPCPEPLLLRMHVLVMRFLGNKDGWAYPRLKDAEIDKGRFPDLYRKLVKLMRTMFQVCHLVHADLSEYNILYHAKTLYIIDVSQSVEHEHPHAFDFLRMDCTNVNDFFRRKDVAVLDLITLFKFVTSQTFGTSEEAMDIELDRLRETMVTGDVGEVPAPTAVLPAEPTTAILPAAVEPTERIVPAPEVGPTTPSPVESAATNPPAAASQPAAEGSGDADQVGRKKKRRVKRKRRIVYTTTFSAEDRKLVDEEVFRHAFLPRTLSEVPDYEGDVIKISRGKGDELLYRKFIGLHLKGDENEADAVAKLPAPRAETVGLTSTKEQLAEGRSGSDAEGQGSPEEEDSDEETSSDEDDSDDSDSDDERPEREPRGKRYEDREAKKERKRLAKEAAREKRKVKMPKAVKKRREKLTSGKKKHGK
ncbi:Serine/threonine-protein kinase rio1 [Tieghemiomyces parasiticus]|uniref:Serine/threonine-protein kinase RIO1 n=1 Tax=Tieghemiomyces parasiticus TaxID=78921 RepID=A0A9W8DZ29_9FUNG|nr:Serine/threonine-protein kinase rio1 [Tieghemiomyces parasiticus]